MRQIKIWFITFFKCAGCGKIKFSFTPEKKVREESVRYFGVLPDGCLEVVCTRCFNELFQHKKAE